MASFYVEDNEAVYSNDPKTMDEALRQIHAWREKYYTLLEKYLAVIEKEKEG